MFNPPAPTTNEFAVILAKSPIILVVTFSVGTFTVVFANILFAYAVPLALKVAVLINEFA